MKNARMHFIALPFLLFFSFSIFGQTQQDIQITPITQINSPALEFSPAYYHSGLVFVSSQFRRGVFDTNIGENTFELLYADLGPKGVLSKPAPLSLKINSKYHEGPVAFTENRNELFFTRSNLENGKPIKDSNGRVQLKIYHATKGKADWENITELSINDDQFTCMHPAITKDGQRLYFASNRPGGYGGMDLYYSDWKGDDWGTPVNLGPQVNTSGFDVFPFIHPSGKLFFASDRQGGMGGLDIYMVDINTSTAAIPVLLPAPINSADDDLGFIINVKGTIAFFSSNRAGGKGKDDLYRANIPNGLNGLFAPKEVTAEVVVRNNDTREALANVALKMVEIPEGKSMYEMTDVYGFIVEKEDKGIVVRYQLQNEFQQDNSTLKTDANGAHSFKVLENKQYAILAGGLEGFNLGLIVFNTFPRNNVKLEILLNPIQKPVEFIPPPPVVLEKGSIIVLDQLYYDFDKSYIRTDASRGLDAILLLMNQYPEMMIQLTAHTDSRGDKNYNQRLSEQRAISAKYYLSSRGVAADRITTQGKGEENPRNGCVDGVNCSEEEHQYNRRTEILIRSLGDLEKIEYQGNLPDYIDVPKKKKGN